MKTYSPRPRDIERRWYVIDAGGAVLGRLSTEVAAILRGKHKPIFAPHMDVGDHVIVVNAKDVRLTGGKEETKIAYRHSGHPGGITATKYGKLLAEKPAYAVEKAIRGMLPKNRLGRAMVKKLQVYAGPEHPHQAQQPQPLKLGEVPAWAGLPEARHAAEAPSRAAGSPKPTARAARPASKPAGSRPAPSRAAASGEEPAEPTTAKRTTAKRATAKRTTAKTATAKTETETATAKRSTAKRSTARRTKEE